MKTLLKEWVHGCARRRGLALLLLVLAGLMFGEVVAAPRFDKKNAVLPPVISEINEPQ